MAITEVNDAPTLNSSTDQAQMRTLPCSCQ